MTNANLKKGQMSKSKGSVQQKGLVIRNTHVKYNSYSTHCSKAISKVKVFKKWVKQLGQGHMVKNNGTL